MAWIESHEELGNHPKTQKLAQILECSVPTAVGYVHLLWHYTIQASWQFGDLTEQMPMAIARGCWYQGNPLDLINALKSSGFIDSDMKVHDWQEYAKPLIYQRLYNTKRKDKKSNNVNTLSKQCKNNVLKASTIPNHTIPNQTNNKDIPTLDEVKAYCQERKNGVDPEKWFDFYSSKGWMIGKNRMKDWKAAVRTWERSESKTMTKEDKDKKFLEAMAKERERDERVKAMCESGE